MKNYGKQSFTLLTAVADTKEAFIQHSRRDCEACDDFALCTKGSRLFTSYRQAQEIYDKHLTKLEQGSILEG